uniref:protein jagged-1-like n=1 Tax=Ciona intestinalis TaxID=7719 RepID=UPI00089DB5DA|nr:protein jagged-1-like [Ciona intestinalis]|eukprot:XP_018672837.1 protein jagged-1-like [Ciona intestinalis]
MEVKQGLVALMLLVVFTNVTISQVEEPEVRQTKKKYDDASNACTTNGSTLLVYDDTWGNVLSGKSCRDLFPYETGQTCFIWVAGNKTGKNLKGCPSMKIPDKIMRTKMCDTQKNYICQSDLSKFLKCPANSTYSLAKQTCKCNPGFIMKDHECQGPEFSYHSHNTWYLVFHETKKNISAAKADCEARNAKLVRILSSSSQDSLNSMFQTLQYNVQNCENGYWPCLFFVGGNYSNNYLQWVDSTKESNYTNWAENEPTNNTNELCVSVVPGNFTKEKKYYIGQWFDDGCSFERHYICEIDFNECELPGICNSSGTCTNTPGGFSCTCDEGYSGNGKYCHDINECKTTSPCHHNASCTNTNGSFNCLCKSGYTGNGTHCADINECKTTSPCHHNANCTNTNGAFTCLCKSGYTGNGTHCAGD